MNEYYRSIWLLNRADSDYFLDNAQREIIKSFNFKDYIRNSLIELNGREFTRLFLQLYEIWNEFTLNDLKDIINYFLSEGKAEPIYVFLVFIANYFNLDPYRLYLSINPNSEYINNAIKANFIDRNEYLVLSEESKNELIKRGINLEGFKKIGESFIKEGAKRLR